MNRATPEPTDLATLAPISREVFLMFLASFIPSAVMVILFSDLGFGIAFFTTVARKNMSLLGDGFVCALVCYMCILYVFDYIERTKKEPIVRTLLGLPIIVFVLFGAMLKGLKYPWAPMMFTLFIVPLLHGIMRLTMCKQVKRSHFYGTSAVVTGVVAFLALCVWVVWMSNGDHWWTEAEKDRLRVESKDIYASIYEVVSSGEQLQYDIHCSPDVDAAHTAANMTMAEEEEYAAIHSACTKANTVWFMVYICPFICFVCNSVMALFGLSVALSFRSQEREQEQELQKQKKEELEAQQKQKEQEGIVSSLMGFVSDVKTHLNCNQSATPPEEQAQETYALKAGALTRLLGFVVGALAFLIAGMYGSFYMTGASLNVASTLMAFFCVAIICLFIWMYLEVDQQELKDYAEKSRYKNHVVKAYESNFMRALAVGSVGVLVLPLLVLIAANEMVRKTCRYKANPGDWCTVGARKHVNHVLEWDWVAILGWICVLGEVFFMFQIGVAKATYIFLSWLNYDVLAYYSFVVALVVVFIAGFIMFMLPPVPGAPVYTFTGLVMATQAEQNGMGLVMGIIIALALSLAMKLTACCGQYAIGFGLGQYVKVQQLIGVDKVPTRAAEEILKRKGLNPAKVVCLIGGPDWPVSVTCGILRLNIPQMIIGTLPVVFLQAPCVLAGAFLVKVTGEADDIWNMLAVSFLGLSVVVQGSAVMAAFILIGREVQTNHKKLAEPREEHKAVADLTEQEKEANLCRAERTKWRQFPWPKKLIILAAAALQLLSGVIFAFMGELTFRPFRVNSKISDSYEQEGLEGDVFSVILPLGLGAFVFFCLGAILHFVHLKLVTKMVKQEMAKGWTSGALGEPVQEPQSGDRGGKDALSNACRPSSLASQSSKDWKTGPDEGAPSRPPTAARGIKEAQHLQQGPAASAGQPQRSR